MAEKLKWNLSLQLVNGPSTQLADDLAVDAYDKISIDIVHNAPAVTVDVQPGEADEVLFLLIHADRYGTGLTYKVNGTGSAVTLDQPQFFLGKGAISVLDAAPKTFEVENKLAEAEDVKLQVLVGRIAV